MAFQRSKNASDVARGGPAAGGGRPEGGAGMPRFLGSQRARVTARPRRHEASEQEADRVAAQWDTPFGPGASRLTTWMSPMARRLAAAGGGAPLPADVAARATTQLGIDAAAVRVHDDPGGARLARSFGAKAVTAGRDIFFAPGRYELETPEGERLLAHELAHVAQQGGEPRAVQCDIHDPAVEVPLGFFAVDMTTLAGGIPGMDVHLEFDPDPAGPYSAQIGLTQVINVTDQSSATGHAAGKPVDWSKMTDSNSITPANPSGTVGTEAGRMEAMTPGTGAREGWYTDAFYDPAIHPRGSEVEPSYEEPDSINPTPGTYGDYGWLRSPTDIGVATLIDSPSMSFDVDFDFQTFARGVDNQVIYGGVEWGFQIRSGGVSGDYAVPLAGATPEFDEALERFRGYFVHEPIVLYFATNDDIPQAGEEAKLAGIADYLDRYPDVQASIEGWADVRGSEAGNQDLAQRRADSAENLLLLQGVPADRVVFNFGFGETQQFSELGTPVGGRQPRDEGHFQANRRAVIRFEHTVSNHPIVMP